MNHDINKNRYQQLEGDKNNSSRSTDDINKMMCNLLLHQSAPVRRSIGISLLHISEIQKLWRKKLVIHMVDWYFSLSLQKEKQRKPSKRHQKADTQELKYC